MIHQITIQSDGNEDLFDLIERHVDNAWLSLKADAESGTDLDIYQDRETWDPNASFLVLLGIDLESNEAAFLPVEVNEAGEPIADDTSRAIRLPLVNLTSMARGLLEF